MKKTILVFIIVLVNFCSLAQSKYYRYDSIPVYQYGRQLAYPWVGGFNSPQFSQIGLTAEGKTLLVVFDRSGNHFYTFSNNNIADSVSYTYEPQYEKNFPVCYNWAFMRDYNCDGIPDIFTSNYSGVEVYRGYYNANNELDFTVAKPLLEFYVPGTGYTNVYVPSSDIPAVAPINGDAGIDVLAFGPTGGFIYYFKNMSQDSGYGCDSLIYTLQSTCFGDVFDNYYLTMDTNMCGSNIYPGAPPHDQVEHHALNTLCPFDEDSSGNTSLVWGGITFPHSTFLHNSGPNDSSVAYINWQDTLFPGYNVPDSMHTLPAAYYLDVDNDGYNDLLFAPNNFSGTEDYDEIRYYKRMPGKATGTKAKQYYSYQNDSLFSKDMIDVGTGSAPAFFHYFNVDTSSIYDLVIGSYGRYNLNAIPNGCLTLYRNTGTRTRPSFQLVSKDFASITNYRLQSIVPTFGNLRDKGTEDMILGNSLGTLYYFENVAPVGSPAQYQLMSPDSGGEFYDSINVNGYSAPQLVDVDGDGLLDLLVGCQDGVIYYYHNDGTATSPKFNLVSSSWGGVFVTDTANKSFIPGFSHPYLYHDSTGKSVLLVGSSPNGYIFRYDNIDNNLNGTFTLTDTDLANISTGFESQCAVSGAKLLGKNNPELAVGNLRGGVTIYRNTPVSELGIAQVASPVLKCNLYPNPAVNNLTINLSGFVTNAPTTVAIEDMLGRTVLVTKYQNSQSVITINTKALTAGLYFCRVTINGNFVVSKFIVSHQ